MFLKKGSKRLINRLISVLTILVMLLIMVPASVSAAGNLDVIVGEASGQAGQTVQVAINLASVANSIPEGYNGLYNANFKLLYDSTALTVGTITRGGLFRYADADVDAAAAADFSAPNKSTAGEIVFLSQDDTAGDRLINSDGVYATINFTIKAGTIVGDYPITFATANPVPRFNALRTDTTTITQATLNTVAGKVIVTAAPVAATGVSLNKDSTTIVQGQSETLEATVAPAGATDKDVTWVSSNTAVATVANGVVSALTAGTTTITVTTNDGGFTDTCAVTVTAAPVAATGVSLNKDSTTIVQGQSETLEATVAPAGATDKDVTWLSSNTAVATVADGVVSALTEGTTTITVTTNDGGFTDTCTITVTAAPVAATGVSLNKDSTTINAGQTETLVATISPAGATDKAVTWSSSNEAVATVTGGDVNALTVGTTTITVTTHDGGFTDTCTVTVTAAVTGVSLNKESTTIKVGQTETLLATIAPAGATDKAVTWLSSNTAVATVVNGVVTANALTEGTTTITVTTNDGGFTDTCTVIVVVPVTGITLDKTSGALNVGQTDTLTPTIAPANATNKTVNWSTSDPAVATVANGVVTAQEKGTATITATTADGGFTATYTVAVKIPVTGISLDKTSVSLIKGKTEVLEATVTPEGASDPTVTWSSSNSAVASVNTTNGEVTAEAAGSAVITATTTDGGFTATCNVTVTPKPFTINNQTSLDPSTPGTPDSLPGIKASATISKTGIYSGSAVVIFQLMKNNTPGPIMAMDYVYDSPLTAYFNVTGSGYTVKVFVLDKFDSSITNAPFSLAELPTN